MKILESYSHKNIFKICVLLCGEKHLYTASSFLLFLKKSLKSKKNHQKYFETNEKLCQI